METTIGLIAALLTTLSFLPQGIKVIRTKNTEGISLLMYLMFVTGVALWLIYGFLIKDQAITLANLVTLLLALPILIIKIRAIYLVREK